MRIALLGAGAIGCYVAARLAAAGAQVQVIARGETLAAIRDNGIHVEGKADLKVRPMAVTIAEAAPADVLISCVKAYAVSAVAADIRRIVRPGGLWICAVNGLPWWYGDKPLQSVDPGGRVRAMFPLAEAVVGVTHIAAETLRPAVTAYRSGRGLVLGGPATTPVLGDASAALDAAGLAGEVVSDIKPTIWNKLYGNAGLNPMTALTGLTVDRLMADAELKALLTEITAEAMAVGRAEGVTPGYTVDERVDIIARLGNFRSSMLQDADAGRPIELDAILGATIEVADRRGIAVPASRRTYALVRAFAATNGLLPA